MKKPCILISACLLGKRTRFDGKSNYNKWVNKLKKHIAFLPVCPEIEIGLGTPRDPLILVRKKRTYYLVDYKNKIDLTDRMVEFSKNYLTNLKNCHGFLLKSRSPSCGFSQTKIYRDFNKKGFLYRRRGLFAQKIKEYFPYYPIEDEERIKNDPWCAYNFLIKVFALKESQDIIKKNPSCEKIQKFHNDYSLLFRMYSRKRERLLNAILNFQNKSCEEKIQQYYDNFLRIFSRKPPLKSLNQIVKEVEKFTLALPNLSYSKKIRMKKLRRFFDKKKISFFSYLQMLNKLLSEEEKKFLSQPLRKFLNPLPFLY